MIQNPHPGPDQHRKLITSSESSFAHAYHGSVGAVVQLVEYRTQWRRNLFGKHGQSRTTFSGGTALNVNCRTTFQAHETFNHHVSDSQSQQTELTYCRSGGEQSHYLHLVAVVLRDADND